MGNAGNVEVDGKGSSSWRSFDGCGGERIAATEQIERLSARHEDILKTLDIALSLTEDMQLAYAQASPQERRCFNQGFFERLEIDSERVAADQRVDPFEQLRHLADSWNLPATPALECQTRSGKDETSAPLARNGGLNVEALVPLQRFVPNGEIVVPVEAALDLAPQARKRRPSYGQIRVPRRDVPKKSP